MDSKLKLKEVPIAALVTDPNNARVHDERNLTAIKNSLEAFGQRKPIVVAPGEGDALVVVAGNGTLEAARSLGWLSLVVAEVPADWDADKARAFAIADNRTAELADWNGYELLSTLSSLDDSMLTAAGFDQLDVKNLQAVWGGAPDLDELANEVGEPTEEDGMVRVAFTVPVDVAARWEMAVKQAGAGGHLENVCTAIQAAYDAIVVEE